MGVIQQADFPGGVFERTRIDHRLALHGAFDPAVHLFQRLFKIRVVSHGRLDFDTVKSRTFFQQQIDLVLVRVPVEIKVALLAQVIPPFQCLHHDEILEQRPPHLVPGKLFRGFDAEQMAGKPRVREVELGRFGQPFARVLEIRGQQGHDIGCLQHGQPRRDRVGADADFVRQLGSLEQRADTPSTKPDERVELHHVLDLQQVAHVLVQVGFHVRRIEEFGHVAPRINRGIEPVEQQVVERRVGGYLPYLEIGHGQQLENGGTPCPRLRNLLQHGELRTARKDKPTVRVIVHHALYVRQKVWGVMYFVQNHALLVLVQESDRVVLGKASHVEVIQGVIRQAREQVSDQGCLAGLAGPVTVMTEK